MLTRPLRAVLLAALFCASVAAFGQACSFQPSVQVAGPERPDNLWQFANWVKVWRMTDDSIVVGVPRLYYREGAFWIGLQTLEPAAWGGTCPQPGETMIAACAYTEAANTTAQRGFYSIGSIVVTAGGITTGSETMQEVPPVSVAVDAGTVTVTWSAVPSQPEVTGYQLVRSADGLATWTSVGALTTGTTAADAPGSGSWWYAVKVAFLSTPVQQYSPHGLAAQAAIP